MYIISFSNTPCVFVCACLKYTLSKYMLYALGFITKECIYLKASTIV